MLTHVPIRCPRCESTVIVVRNSRASGERRATQLRCRSCGNRWKTYERIRRIIVRVDGQ